MVSVGGGAADEKLMSFCAAWYLSGAQGKAWSSGLCVYDVLYCEVFKLYRYLSGIAKVTEN